jgi:hypothetical protein
LLERSLCIAQAEKTTVQEKPRAEEEKSPGKVCQTTERRCKKKTCFWLSGQKKIPSGGHGIALWVFAKRKVRKPSSLDRHMQGKRGSPKRKAHGLATVGQDKE